jgi:hypothetical protein
LRRIALTDPPKATEPITPEKKSIAACDSMPKLKGRARARATTPPNPGKIPKMSPIIDPKKRYARLAGIMR